MNEKLPLFNWSLLRLLKTEPDSFNRVRIKILYLFLIAGLVKVAIVIPIASANDQYFHLSRAVLLLAAYAVIMKMLLINAKNTTAIAHVMLGIGLVLITSSVLVVAHLTPVLLQMVFMIILGSFYLLGTRFAIIYSVLGVLPVIIFMATREAGQVLEGKEELAAPGMLLLMILNYLTIIGWFYLYHRAFNTNLAEKDTLNEKLQIAVKHANLNAESKSNFLSTMSHELRTPLNSVIGMTDVLLHDKHTMEQQENLNVLRFSAESLRTLINDILDFNKLDSEKITLEKVSTDISKLIRTICMGLQLQAREKGLELILHIDEGIQSRAVFTDPTRITQIIYNLVGNAIKFTRQGRIAVSLRLVRSTSESMRILFIVEDTGIGIDPSRQIDIFEAFVQESIRTTRHFGGTGLGLAIVKRLLRLFETDIQLHSKPGHGSRFSFEMELACDQEAEQATREISGEETALEGMRVLIAEDNSINVFLVKKLAQRWNLNLEVAENGMAVLERLRTKSYQVILMDIHMPYMDGYETTRQIRSMPTQQASVPIIALTASVTHDLQKRIREAGMNDYLRKPFNAQELYSKLRKHATQWPVANVVAKV